jgi:hypothetical protein
MAWQQMNSSPAFHHMTLMAQCESENTQEKEPKSYHGSTIFANYLEKVHPFLFTPSRARNQSLSTSTTH